MADPAPRSLVVETNERFWNLTGYKRGQRLSRSDPADVRMMPVWMDIYRQVVRERAALGTGPDQPIVQPTPPAVRPVPQARPDRQPTGPAAEEPGMSPATKGVLIAGGLLAAGMIGTFLYSRGAAPR